MDWIQILIIGVLLFIVLALIFKRYVNALFYDYVVDFGLSIIDGPLPFGDLVAGIIIFKKEKKITNLFFASTVAWEAMNFFPIGLVPGVGLVTGFFPAVTVGRMIFNKFGPAEEKEKKLEKEIDVAEKIGIDVSKEKKALERIKKLINNDDPVDALKEEKKVDNELSEKLIKYVGELIRNVNIIIENIGNQEIQATQEMINFLEHEVINTQEMIGRAKIAEKKGDFQTAIENAKLAKNIILNAIEQFDNAVNQI